MRTAELAAWSMALGAIATLALARLADFAARPHLSRLRGCGYHLAVFALVLVLSGLLARLAPLPPEWVHTLQVLAGPCCVGLANHWIRAWLDAARRDRVIESGLQASGAVLPLAACATLLLPRDTRLPAAAVLALAGSGLTVWLTARAALLGDRLAAWMAGGCGLALLALAGLYGAALHAAPWPWPALAAVAACTALSNAITGYLLWRRDCDAWHVRALDPPGGLDPVTRLPCGVALGRLLVAAERRRRRNRRRGALLAVVVFDLERIAAQAGTAGTHEFIATLAARMQRELGLVNPVGRYWERCFVTLVESVQAPGTARSLGLRLAARLRQPVEVRGFGRERLRLRPDIGVGVVPLAEAGMELEDMLHEGQALAEAARRLHQRTAGFEAARAPPRIAGPGGRPAF